jgi:hypothetical protein
MNVRKKRRNERKENKKKSKCVKKARNLPVEINEY